MGKRITPRRRATLRPDYFDALRLRSRAGPQRKSYVDEMPADQTDKYRARWCPFAIAENSTVHRMKAGDFDGAKTLRAKIDMQALNKIHSATRFSLDPARNIITLKQVVHRWH